MAQKPPVADGQPWLGLRMILCAAILLIATRVTDDADTFARWLIIALWVLTAAASMLKEALTYGLGDRVTLFGMMLILAVSITAALIDHHPYSFVSIASVVLALLLLQQAFKEVRARQEAVQSWRGPG